MHKLRITCFAAGMMMTAACQKTATGFEATVSEDAVVTETAMHEDQMISDLAQLNRLAVVFGGPQMVHGPDEDSYDEEKGAMANTGHRRNSPSRARR